MDEQDLTPQQIASSSLLSYVGLQYPKYIAEPAHELMATALEAVEAGNIRRLLINIPPQHGKPAWEEEQVLMGNGNYKKLKDIVIGDYVITHKRRPKKVLKIYKQGLLQTLEFKTNSGRNPCTAKDHPFLTFRGWVEANKLTTLDNLIIIKNTNKLQSSYLPDQITTIKNTGMRKCRCLFVEDDHTFTIQNIVIHNTLLASEFFPSWIMGRHPDWKIIAATFNQTRANEVGAIVRNNLTNQVHRTVFPNCHILQDTKSTHHVATSQRGHYYSTGIGGTITGRGANCLSGDTKVQIKSFLMPVPYKIKLEKLESIEGKFEILCFDHSTKRNIYKPIQAIQKRSTNFIYEIKTENGIIIYATAEHLFYIENKKEYIAIKYLNSGDIFLTQYGQQEKINTIIARKVPQTIVYDIQVEGTNNFFANEILVHNCFILDDPIKDREDAESKLVREKVKEWYRAVAYTRLRPDNRIIIIQTRWHKSDITGFVLEEHAHENWTILELRAIAEKDDILGRPMGAALCPKMYDEKYLANVKLIEGTYNWESLYQQRPIPKEGGMVQYDWIKHYTELPDENEIQKTIISWDTAYKEDQLSDPTAATVWHVTKNGYYLVDVLNKKLTFPNLVKKVKELHNIHNPSAHLIEGRASGQSLIQELKQSTTIPVIEISTKNMEKKVRFDAVTTFFESGKIWLPEKAHWKTEVEDQICLFPATKFDDIVDSVSQFLNWTNKPRYVRRPASKLYWK